MKRVFSLIMVCMLCLSMFTIFAPKASASSDLLSLPAAPYGWQYSDGSHNTLMVNPLAGPLVSVSEQSISASPGQTVSVSVTYQVFAQSPPNNPSEIDQLFFVESWTTSWPPQGYTIPLYNGIPGLNPGVTQTNTISFTVPTVSGTYYLWLCFEAQYSMQDAVNQRTVSMNGLPAHIKIVVSAPAAYLTDIVQLTTNPYRDWQPIWSKDGSEIVYFAYDNDWDRHIWVMNADGTGKTQLTFGNVLDESGDFSPDGKIVFIRYAIDRGIDGFDLWTMNSDGSNLQRLTSTGLHHGLPRWSHDGQKLAFYYGGAGTNTNEIHIMNADGTNEVMVVSSSYPGMSASWSPNDKELAYTMDDGIWLVNTFPPYDKTHLYQTSLPANQVAFSPDGKYILYSSGVSGQLQDLYLIDSNGNFIAQLTNDAKIGYPFDWSPDGQYIAFGSLKSGNADVWRAKIVTDSGLVGYWKFDEGSGNSASDSSGNGNDGVLINNPQWITGVSGGALSFDGQSSYVNIPDSQSLRPSGNAVSVELWFKPTVTLDSSTPATLFIQKGNSYAVWINMPPQQPTPNGKIGFIVSTDSPYYNGHWIESTTNQWLAGTWYHIVGTYDGTSLKIYVNGILENSVALTGTYLTSDSYSLAIAAYDMAAGWRPWFFNGAIDEVKIYSYARTAEEIRADASPVRAWKDDSSLGLENDRLYLHGLAVTGNELWFFDYLVFKDTGTTWYQPWGELAIIVYPLYLWRWTTFTSYEIHAITEADKAYLTYSIVKDNLKEDITYTIYPDKPYINITCSLTNVGPTTSSTYAGAQFTTWIAGNYANDYYYVPGHGQGQFTGGSGNIQFNDATETWVAEWDQNKGEGCGILSTKGFVPHNAISEDFGYGEGFKFISDNFDLAPGQTSATYDCCLYFFTGIGSQQTKDFYDLLAPTQKRILIVNSPGTFGETWYLPDGTPFTLMSYLRNNGFAVDLLTDISGRPLSPTMVPSYDVVILPAWFFDTPENLQYQTVLLNYVQQGGGLLFAGQSGFAQTLDESLGFKYVDGGFVDASIVDYSHPIMQGISELPKAGGVFVDWDNVIADTPLPSDVAILARTTDPSNRIALIAFQYGNGRVVAGPSDGLLRPYGPTGVDSWSPTSQPVTENKLLINAINWVARSPPPQQYQITFDQTGLGNDITGTVVTIDGTTYGASALPKSFSWPADSVHTYSFASPLNVHDGHYVWVSTTGLSTGQSDSLTVTASGSIVGNYMFNPQTGKSPLIEWSKTYGWWFAYSVVQTDDDGYALGTVDGSGIHLVKTDSVGNFQWEHAYGGSSFSEGGSMVQTNDGGYALLSGSFYLVKTDVSGNMQWSKTYGGGGYNYAYSVIQTSDGGYAVAGYTWLLSNSVFFMVKTDASGIAQWSKTYGGAGYDICYCVIQTRDGGYALAGMSGSFDAYLIKTDRWGNVQWSKTYGGPVDDACRSLIQTSDGGYALAGYTDSFGTGRQSYLVKTDSSGNQQWSKSYTERDESWAYSVVQTSDGGYALAGDSLLGSQDNGDMDGFLAKTDVSGNLLWSSTYGSSYDRFRSLVQTRDGGYAVAGGTMGGAWLVKLASEAPQPAQPDFEISVSQSEMVASPSAPTSCIVTITSLDGFDSSVTLSTVPISGLTSTFSANPITPPKWGSASSTLSISSLSTQIRSYDILVVASSGVTTHSVTVSLTVPFMSVLYLSQGDVNWCEPTSVAMICDFYGKQIHQADAASGLLMYHNGWSWPLYPWPTDYKGRINNYFESLGLATETHPGSDWNRGNVQVMLNSGCPILLTIGDGSHPLHSVVVTGFNLKTDTLFINDPSGFLVESGWFDNGVYHSLAPGAYMPCVQIPVVFSDLDQYFAHTQRTVDSWIGVSGNPNPSVGLLNIIGGDATEYKTVSISHDAYQPWTDSVSIWWGGFGSSSTNGLAWSSGQTLYPNDYLAVFAPDGGSQLLQAAIMNPTDAERDYRFEITFSLDGTIVASATSTLSDVGGSSMVNSPYSRQSPLRLGDLLRESGEYSIGLDLYDASGSLIDQINLPEIRYATSSLGFLMFSSADLFVTDPLGHSTGVNPASGNIVNEIPGAFYSGPSTEPEVIMIPDPLDGKYGITLIGTGTGNYTLTTEYVTATQTATQTLNGAISLREKQNLAASISGTGVCVQCQVSFTLSPLTVGTVNPGGTAYYDAGSTISISATAKTGYTFWKWSSNTPYITFANGSSTATTATINGPGVITATFALLVSGNRHVTLTGSDNVVIITGGNDIIDATQATATTVIKTGPGNDIINLGGGNNIVIETAGGNDIITAGNGDNTIAIAGNGNYLITTGSGNDQIQITGGGNSIINAGNGNNIVTVSGKGNNQITTGSGNDVVMAGNGNNIIKTGAGNDNITVGNGNNYIDGGTGYDVCIHGTGHNTILNCEKT